MDAETAFAELVRRHEARIFGLCHRMLGDADEARDVAQEVFVAAWQGLGRFRAESAVYTWLYRIAVNLSLRRRRTLGRFRRALARFAGLVPDPEGATRRDPEDPRHADPTRGKGEPAFGGERPAFDPERSAETSEQRRLLERAMRILSPDARAAILLRDRDGLAYEELADVLDWKVGTVKSRISRARAAVADEIRRIAPDLERPGRSR